MTNVRRGDVRDAAPRTRLCVSVETLEITPSLQCVRAVSFTLSESLSFVAGSMTAALVTSSSSGPLPPPSAVPAAVGLDMDSLFVGLVHEPTPATSTAGSAGCSVTATPTAGNENVAGLLPSGWGGPLPMQNPQPPPSVPSRDHSPVTLNATNRPVDADALRPSSSVNLEVAPAPSSARVVRPPSPAISFRAEAVRADSGSSSTDGRLPVVNSRDCSRGKNATAAMPLEEVGGRGGGPAVGSAPSSYDARLSMRRTAAALLSIAQCFCQDEEQHRATMQQTVGHLCCLPRDWERTALAWVVSLQPDVRRLKGAVPPAGGGGHEEHESLLTEAGRRTGRPELLVPISDTSPLRRVATEAEIDALLGALPLWLAQHTRFVAALRSALGLAADRASKGGGGAVVQPLSPVGSRKILLAAAAHHRRTKSATEDATSLLETESDVACRGEAVLTGSPLTALAHLLGVFGCRVGHLLSSAARPSVSSPQAASAVLGRWDSEAFGMGVVGRGHSPERSAAASNRADNDGSRAANPHRLRRSQSSLSGFAIRQALAAPGGTGLHSPLPGLTGPKPASASAANLAAGEAAASAVSGDTVPWDCVLDGLQRYASSYSNRTLPALLDADERLRSAGVCLGPLGLMTHGPTTEDAVSFTTNSGEGGLRQKGGRSGDVQSGRVVDDDDDERGAGGPPVRVQHAAALAATISRCLTASEHRGSIAGLDASPPRSTVAPHRDEHAGDGEGCDDPVASTAPLPALTTTVARDLPDRDPEAMLLDSSSAGKPPPPPTDDAVAREERAGGSAAPPPPPAAHAALPPGSSAGTNLHSTFIEEGDSDDVLLRLVQRYALHRALLHGGYDTPYTDLAVLLEKPLGRLGRWAQVLFQCHQLLMRERLRCGAAEAAVHRGHHDNKGGGAVDDVIPSGTTMVYILEEACDQLLTLRARVTRLLRGCRQAVLRVTQLMSLWSHLSVFDPDSVPPARRAYVILRSTAALSPQTPGAGGLWWWPGESPYRGRIAARAIASVTRAGFENEGTDPLNVVTPRVWHAGQLVKRFSRGRHVRWCAVLGNVLLYGERLWGAPVVGDAASVGGPVASHQRKSPSRSGPPSALPGRGHHDDVDHSGIDRDDTRNVSLSPALASHTVRYSGGIALAWPVAAVAPSAGRPLGLPSCGPRPDGRLGNQSVPPQRAWDAAAILPLEVRSTPTTDATSADASLAWTKATCGRLPVVQRPGRNSEALTERYGFFVEGAEICAVSSAAAAAVKAPPLPLKRLELFAASEIELSLWIAAVQQTSTAALSAARSKPSEGRSTDPKAAMAASRSPLSPDDSPSFPPPSASLGRWQCEQQLLLRYLQRPPPPPPSPSAAAAA